MYRKIRFKEIGYTEPEYFQIKNEIVLSRYQCQKHKLKDILENSFNSNLSEDKNMKFNDFFKIYNTGNLVFIKIF